mgnify:CR=1 FL=1
MKNFLVLLGIIMVGCVAGLIGTHLKIAPLQGVGFMVALSGIVLILAQSRE